MRAAGEIAPYVLSKNDGTEIVVIALVLPVPLVKGTGNKKFGCL